jgi:hypothetical protein
VSQSLQKPNKRIAALCKLFGTVLILAALGVQFLVYDLYEAQLRETRDLTVLGKQSDLTSKLSELLYINTGCVHGTSSDLLKRHCAALLSQSAEVVVLFGATANTLLNTPSAQQGFEIADEIVEAGKVASIEELWTYRDSRSIRTRTDIAKMVDRVQQAQSLKKTYRWLHVAAYLLGSIFLTLGIAFELRGSQE